MTFSAQLRFETSPNGDEYHRCPRFHLIQLEQIIGIDEELQFSGNVPAPGHICGIIPLELSSALTEIYESSLGDEALLASRTSRTLRAMASGENGF